MRCYIGNLLQMYFLILISLEEPNFGSSRNYAKGQCYKFFIVIVLTEGIYTLCKLWLVEKDIF